jgi:zinc transporter ZupT
VVVVAIISWIYGYKQQKVENLIFTLIGGAVVYLMLKGLANLLLNG